MTSHVSQEFSEAHEWFENLRDEIVSELEKIEENKFPEVKWSANGDIFVRRNKRSKSIRITNEKLLNDLINAQKYPANQDVVPQPQKQPSAEEVIDVSTSALPHSSALPNHIPFRMLQCPSPPLSPQPLLIGVNFWNHDAHRFPG